MALELAGVARDTPNPQGGEILKTEDGEVLGCVTDNVRDFFTNITSAMDAGCDVTDIENDQDLYETGRMKLRTYPLVRLLDTANAQADYVRENLPAGMIYDNCY